MISFKNFNMFGDAFLSGFCACIGSIFGKVAGDSEFIGESSTAKILSLVLMISFNTLGCRHYARALDLSTDSVKPTVTSVATNYITSCILGMMLFNEMVTTLWWCGASLMLVGLMLITSSTRR